MSYASLEFAEMLAAERDRLRQERDRLYRAGQLFLKEYVEMVDSGDCGFWDPEEEKKVKKMRAALQIQDPPDGSDEGAGE